MPSYTLTELHALFDASGLSTAPPQTWRGLRLVPVIARDPIKDLRLSRRVYEESLSIVELPQDMAYWSYIPHAYVLEYSPDGEALAMTNTMIQKGNGDGKRWKTIPVRILKRMARRERHGRGHRLRFLPLHLAMEGLLAEHFNAPSIDWRDDYRRAAISHGLSPRSTRIAPGAAIDGLEEALRIFEIHRNQVGLLLFSAEALTTAIVYPNPADYRHLHRSLLEDFFSEVIAYYYSYLPYLAADFGLPAAEGLSSWADLQAALKARRGELDDFQRLMAAGVLARPVRLREVQGIGPYKLQRFVSDLDSDETLDAHMGEVILGPERRLAYLKTCALTPAQIRQARLLELLDRHLWQLKAAATSLNMSLDDFVLKLDSAGLGRLLQPQLIDQARKRLRVKA